ncbi:TIR-like protein FxsC [Streptomyces mauvecolor]|uniref:TIR-like protein FxsC n=1 Tax=Streptomyces mauvecolor TaxID=58345 RepID=A0ABV9UHM9_9ACTN
MTGKEGEAPVPDGPYFFLSYAPATGRGGSGPDPDMWVGRLFEDLCRGVAELTALPAGTPPGFMDRGPRPGGAWSEQLGRSLASCRVFVPLFSPRYFASEWCGKEWYAFAQRAIRHRAATNRPADAIVPALWIPVPPRQLPLPAEQLGFDHRDVGERYAADGLYGLIKLRLFAEEYRRAVHCLARHIVGAAHTGRVGPGRPLDHRTLPSAFGTAAGPRALRVTVAAPTRDELPEGRDGVYYGQSPLDWNPYHPDTQRPLALVADDIAGSLNYRPTVASFDDESPPGEESGPPSGPEVLLVDRWALLDENRRARLAALDAADRPWISVVVPWNRDDPQSRAAADELTARTAATLPSRVSHGRPACRAAARGVESIDAFEELLPHVVEAAAQQYLRHAPAHPPAGRAPTQRPRLIGPMDHGPQAGHRTVQPHDALDGAPDVEDTDDSQP